MTDLVSGLRSKVVLFLVGNHGESKTREVYEIYNILVLEEHAFSGT